MFQLALGGYPWWLHHLKSFQTPRIVSYHTCVCLLISRSYRILWHFFIVLSGLSTIIDCLGNWLTSFLDFAVFHVLFIDVQSIFSSHYEEYLGEKFPFGSYKQIFIAPEMAVSSSSLGASMSIFSSQVLYDENIIDKVWLHNMSVVLPLCKLRYMCICAKTQYLGDV